MSKYNLLDIHEGKSFEDSQEKSREEKHPEKKTIDKIRALMAKEKNVDENEAVDLAIEASQEKAGIKEARVDRDVEERIEGLLHRELKRKFLFAFEDLYSDLIEEDPFHAEDVINHLNNEMHKHLKSFQNTGDKFAGIPEIPGFEGTRDALDDISIRESSDDYVDEIGEGAMQPGEADLEAGVTGNMDAYTEEIDYKLDPYEDRDKIIKQVMSLLIKEKGASKEELKGFIKTHMEDILNAKDEDDIVDEFSQYLSVNEGDRALQEHFGRFMKDYQ